MVEPTTLDPPYVPISDSESFGHHDSVIGLEPKEEVAPNTANDTACLEEMDRDLPIYANVKKMCKRFNQSMVVGSAAMETLQKGTPNVRKLPSRSITDGCGHVLMLKRMR